MNRQEIIQYYNSLASTTEPTNAWSKRLKNIKNNIHTLNIDTFFSWPDIIFTMGGEAGRNYCVEMKKSLPNKWFTMMAPEKVGNSGKPHTTSGKVTHAYYIHQFEKFSSLSINEIPNIIEFGAGYGNMCYILNKVGFSGNYDIYDFPELCAIQYYYLKSHGVNNFNHICNMDNIHINNKTMFISTHSLEEAPKELIINFLDKIKSVSYLVVAFNGNFPEIKSFAKENDFVFNISLIPLMKDSHILVGYKND